MYPKEGLLGSHRAQAIQTLPPSQCLGQEDVSTPTPTSHVV